MQRWVALLRGVNVGGGNRVPMADLRTALEARGFEGVRSYIASGNLVLGGDGPADRIAAEVRAALSEGFGVDVPVLVLPDEALTAILADCPFDGEGKTIHAFFCFGDPVIDAEARDRWIAASETLAVRGRTVWLHAPDGIGRSALAERIGRVVTGTDLTARNLNTVRKLAAMAAE